MNLKGLKIDDLIFVSVHPTRKYVHKHAAKKEHPCTPYVYYAPLFTMPEFFVILGSVGNPENTGYNGQKYNFILCDINNSIKSMEDVSSIFNWFKQSPAVETQMR